MYLTTLNDISFVTLTEINKYIKLHRLKNIGRIDIFI